MPDEYGAYLSIAEAVPYVQYFVAAGKFIDQMYNFGREGQEGKALRLLQEQVLVISADIKDLNGRTDALNRRVIQVENLARMRTLNEHHIEIQGLVKRMGRTPDVNDLSDIAGTAALRIDAMLNDKDLWLWSDIGVRRSPGGGEVTELAEPDFKVLPIPVLAAATAVFCFASAMHISREPAAHAVYAGDSARFLAAVSLRTDFKDGSVEPKTLPEQIRSRISVTISTATKYVTNGQCEYGFVLTNLIDRRTTILPDLVVIPAAAGSPSNTLCTAPATLGWAQEAEAEDAYPPLQILATLEMMLYRITHSGSLADPYIGQFADFTQHTLFLYAVESGGRLVRFQCEVRTDLAEPVVQWQSDGVTIGTGWNSFTTVVPGDWNVLYGLLSDNSVLWYRHDGAPNNTRVWSGPNTVSPAYLTLGKESAVPIVGSHGRIYRAVNRTASGGGGRGEFREISFRKISELTIDRHAGYDTGAGEFAGQVVIHNQWPSYVTQFGGRDGVIYGIDAEGTLFWHRHEDAPQGGTINGPHPVGTGWNSFAQVFSAGRGFLFGVYPNGTMVAYHLRFTGGGTPPQWHGPVPVELSGWNTFDHLVPMFDEEPTIVR